MYQVHKNIVHQNKHGLFLSSWCTY